MEENGAEEEQAATKIQAGFKGIVCLSQLSLLLGCLV